MKFCQVVPEICRGQVHGPRKERRKRKRKRKRKRIIIIIRNEAKSISLPNLVWRLNNLVNLKFEPLLALNTAALALLRIFKFLIMAAILKEFQTYQIQYRMGITKGLSL
jgi:hypothetical protein